MNNPLGMKNGKREKTKKPNRIIGGDQKGPKLYSAELTNQVLLTSLEFN